MKYGFILLFNYKYYTTGLPYLPKSFYKWSFKTVKIARTFNTSSCQVIKKIKFCFIYTHLKRYFWNSWHWYSYVFNNVEMVQFFTDCQMWNTRTPHAVGDELILSGIDEVIYTLLHKPVTFQGNYWYVSGKFLRSYSYNIQAIRTQPYAFGI